MSSRDPEKRREWQRNYYAKNRERIREREREYYKKYGVIRNTRRRELGQLTGNKTGKHLENNEILGSKNGRWKGGWTEERWKREELSYKYLHLWVSKLFGQPTTCEFCGKTGLTGKKIGWANKSRKYISERTDWLRLCGKCHYQYDEQNKRKDKLGRWQSW